MKAKRLLLLAAALLASALAGAQTTYRWTDASGKTVFSDQPPPSGARQVVRSGGEAPGEAPQLSYAARQAAEKYPVALYTAENCTDLCVRAREFLAERSIPYAERVVASEEENAELARLLGAAASVPSLIVGRQSVRGFEAGAWSTLLDLAGYPKTGARAAARTASGGAR